MAAIDIISIPFFDHVISAFRSAFTQGDAVETHDTHEEILASRAFYQEMIGHDPEAFSSDIEVLAMMAHR